MKLKIVSARTGIVWVRLGIQVYFKQPLALTGLFFLFMATLSVLNLVPVLGSVASLMLLPALGLGLMAAAIRDPDPVIVCEHKALFAIKGEVPDGELWQASAFRGGELPYRALLDAEDQRGTALRFLGERLQALTG